MSSYCVLNLLLFAMEGDKHEWQGSVVYGFISVCGFACASHSGHYLAWKC